MNPAVIEAFALAICAAGEGPAYPGIVGHEPNITDGRRDHAALESAISALRKVAPASGSYLSESDYFLETWQSAHWGSNYEKLMKIKRRYDPAELFIVHHGVGSEKWSQDGFSKIKSI
jgi:FAD/FMN-containing dehydrogenase